MLYRYHILIVSVGLLLTNVQPMQAQQPRDTLTTGTHAVQEVAIHGVRLSRNVTCSKPLQEMERPQIEALGLENLADAVKRFAGVSLRDYGGLGGMKTVSVRSLGAHHTTVSLDGVVLSNTQAGQIDIGRYGLDGVERISLGIGDGGDLLQTARHYASGGVLSMESRSEKPRYGKQHEMQAGVQVGAWGYVRPSLRWAQRFGEKSAYSVSGSFLHSDGDYPFTLTNVRKRTKEKRMNGAMRAWQGEANFSHRFTTHDSLRVKAYWYWSRRGLPGSVVYYSNLSDETLWDEDFFSQATYDNRLNQKLALRAHLKFAHSWNRYEDPHTEYDGVLQMDRDRQNEYYGSATLLWMPLEHLSMSVAQDLSYNTLRTNIPLYNNTKLPNPRRFTSLTALSALWQTERLKVSGNVVGTFADERVDYTESPADRKRLSPTLSLTWHPSENVPVYVRAMWKNTFRLPSFNDLYYRRSGNPKLRPEKARLYGVGLTEYVATRGALRYTSMTVDGYYNRVTDKIVAFPSTYVWRMANYGRVRIWGVDATLTSEWVLARNYTLTLYGTYTYQCARDYTNSSSQTYKEQLPYTPWHSANGSATLHTPWVNVGYVLTYCGHRYSSAQNKSEYCVDSYVLHDVTLSRTLDLPQCRVLLSASVQNLLDEQYDIVKFYPMPGRSFRVSASVEL